MSEHANSTSGNEITKGAVSGTSLIQHFATSETPVSPQDIEPPRELSYIERFTYLDAQNKFYDRSTLTTASREDVRFQLASTYGLRRNGPVDFVEQALVALPHAHDMLYAPASAPGVFRHFDRKLYVNSFNHEGVALPNPKWHQHPLAKAWELNLAFLFPQGTHDIERNMMRWFLAHNMRCPGKRILWAPLVIGPQGDGKSTLTYAMDLVLGMENTHGVSGKELGSDFIAWAGTKAFVTFEELLMAGRKFDNYEDLKPYITDRTVNNHTKGSTAKKVLNTGNIQGNSNHMDAVPVQTGDRRWAINATALMDKGEGEAADILGREQGRLQELNRLLDLPEAAGVLQGWAHSIDMDMFNAKSHAPSTRAKIDLTQSNHNPIRSDLEELVNMGTYWGITPHAVHIGAAQFWLNFVHKHDEAKLKPQAIQSMLRNMGFGPALKKPGEPGNATDGTYRVEVYVPYDDFGLAKKKRKYTAVMLRNPRDVPDLTGMFNDLVTGNVSFISYAGAMKEAMEQYKEEKSRTESDDGDGNLPF